MTEATTEVVATPSSKIGFLKRQDVRFGSPTRLHRAVASQLLPGNLNTRDWETFDNRVAVVKMANSIWENSVFTDGKLEKSGVLDPIRAVNMGDEPGLIDAGETRWRAVRLIEGFDMLANKPGAVGEGVLTGMNFPVAFGQVEPDTITFDVFYIDRAMSIVERRFGVVLSNEQRPFTDLEWAAQIAAFMTDDPENDVKAVPMNEIARRIGREPTWVSHINKLNNVPAEVLPLLRSGQVKTTVMIDLMEDQGADEAAKLIIEATEIGKKQWEAEYEDAMAEARVAQADFAKIAGTPEAEMPANQNSGSRRLTKGEVARRRVTTATTKATNAQRQSKNGPDRVTGRAVRERVAAKSAGTTESTAAETPADATGKVVPNRSNIDTLVEAVIFAAKRSREPNIREAMNATLKRVGHATVESMVDNDGNELPVPGEDVAEVVETAATA